MFFFYKIINTIDGILDKIPRDIALQIKRLMTFLLVIFVFLAIYIGYKFGKEASQIPGDPLVRVTNDVLRLKLGDKNRNQEKRLILDGNPVMPVHDELTPERVNLNGYKPRVNEQPLYNKGLSHPSLKSEKNRVLDSDSRPLDLSILRKEGYYPLSQRQIRKAADKIEPLDPNIILRKPQDLEQGIQDNLRKRKDRGSGNLNEQNERRSKALLKNKEDKPLEKRGDLRDLDNSKVDPSGHSGKGDTSSQRISPANSSQKYRTTKSKTIKGSDSTNPLEPPLKRNNRDIRDLN